MALGEFDLIGDYLVALTEGRDEAQGLKDDVAWLQVPEGYELVVSTDSLHEEIHFFKGTDPGTIAQKALRSSISDIISAGAKPVSYQMALSFAEMPDEAWLTKFCAALRADHQRYDLYCNGGDTTRIRYGRSVTITMFGLRAAELKLSRMGAQPGDVVYVSGQIGHGGFAFDHLRTVVPDVPYGLYPLMARYASACADISDGVIADAAHIAQVSKAVDIHLYEADIPVISGIEPREALVAGDDYQLLFTVHAEQVEAFEAALEETNIPCSAIGKVIGGSGKVDLFDIHGQRVKLSNCGWQHF